MSSRPLVSILIPVYNRQDLIVEAIESALVQTYRDIEVVVIDNKSTDHTWKILEEIALTDKRIKIHQNSENVGPVLNWKIGFELCKGPYIKILWSDDLITPDFVEKTVALFDEETAFVLTGISFFGDQTYRSRFQDYFPSILSTTTYLEENILSTQYESFPLSPGCAIFRRSDLISNLKIDIPNNFGMDFKRYGAGNDLLMFLLTALNYKHVKIIPELYSKFRVHGNSFSVENNLEKYYDLAKLYFIDHYKTSLKQLFAVGLYYKRNRDEQYAWIWETNKDSFNLFALLRFKFSRLVTRLKQSTVD